MPRYRRLLMAFLFCVTLLSSLTLPSPAQAQRFCAWCDETNCGCEQPWSGCVLRNYSCSCGFHECYRNCQWLCPI